MELLTYLCIKRLFINPSPLLLVWKKGEGEEWFLIVLVCYPLEVADCFFIILEMFIDKVLNLVPQVGV